MKEHDTANSSSAEDEPMIDTDKIIESFIASEDMNRVANYLSRGRCFSSLDLSTLKDNWTAAFKLMTKPDGLRHVIEVGDLTAELELRGVAVPSETVAAEISLLAADCKRDLIENREKHLKVIRNDLGDFLRKSRH